MSAGIKAAQSLQTFLIHSRGAVAWQKDRNIRANQLVTATTGPMGIFSLAFEYLILTFGRNPSLQRDLSNLTIVHVIEPVEKCGVQLK